MHKFPNLKTLYRNILMHNGQNIYSFFISSDVRKQFFKYFMKIRLFDIRYSLEMNQVSDHVKDFLAASTAAKRDTMLNLVYGPNLQNGTRYPTV